MNFLSAKPPPSTANVSFDCQDCEWAAIHKCKLHSGNKPAKESHPEERKPQNGDGEDVLQQQYSFAPKNNWGMQSNVQNVNNININISSGVKVLQIGHAEGSPEPKVFQSQSKGEIHSVGTQQNGSKQSKAEGTGSKVSKAEGTGKPSSGPLSPESHLALVIPQRWEYKLKVQSEDKPDSRTSGTVPLRIISVSKTSSLDDPAKRELYS